MHSTADPLLTEMAMKDSKRNTRKIVLATNIAESSITVPDVKYGISIGKSSKPLENVSQIKGNNFRFSSPFHL